MIFFSDDICINYVELKIYFDSRQVEIMSTNDNRSSKILSSIREFHNLRLGKWYKNYFLSIWLKNCIKNGYSFDGQSEV